MKKRFFILLFLLSMFYSTGAVFASPTITVVIDGQVQKYDQPPVIISDRTLVPLRGVFEALGAEVKWDNQTQTATATKENTTLVVKAGSDTVALNGETLKLVPKPQIINGRTMVPIRFVSDALGAKVEWDDLTQTVIISTQEHLKQFKEALKKDVIFTWNKGHGWTKVSGEGSTIAEDPIHFKSGRQSLKLVATTADCVAEKKQPVNLQGKILHLDLYVHDITKLSEVHLVMGTTQNWTSYFGYTIHANSLKNGWNSITLLPAAFYRLGTSPPAYSELTNIQRWRVRIVGVKGQEAMVSFDSLQAVSHPQRGKVTITFDDGYTTTYTEAKQRMDQHGFPGVAYIITDLAGTPGRMTLDQLQGLHEAGWDVSSHTKTHKLLVSDSPNADEIKRELLDSKKWLIHNGFYRGAQHYSSPGGQFNEEILNEIKNYYRTHRTIMEEKECYPPADPYLLKIRNIINTTPVEAVQRWIDEAAANKEWLILVFHKVAEPADIETIVPPSAFQAIVDYLGKANVDVVTMSDLVSQ